MRIAILSNITSGFLADVIKREHICWFPDGHAQWIQECLDPSPAFRDFSPAVVLILLDGRTIFEVDDDLNIFSAAIESLRQQFPNALIAVSNIDVPNIRIRPLVAAHDERILESRWQEILNRLVYENHGMCIFDLKAIVEDMGRAKFYDERMRYAGAMPYSIFGLKETAKSISELLRAYVGRRKKVLAVDLDNTLWKGVIGEDGAAGVRLAPDKDGLPFTDFQRRLKELKASGVLLVALSKNNAADVEPIWQDSRMILKKEDFVIIRTDWNDKPANLSAVAQELNLGIDSFVFIDDNPAEREQMRAILPSVSVPNFPHDDADLESFAHLLAYEYFPCYRMTQEDKVKTEQYRAESSRKAFAKSGISIQDYLVGLGQWVVIHPVRQNEIDRVSQLSQKTNQFNVTTHRYELADVKCLAEDPSRILLTVHAGDRFGGQGLVAFVTVFVLGESARIEDFVMSCRVMNRTVEMAVESALEELLLSRGCSMIEAAYLPTLKNKPVSELFEKLGFRVVSERGGAKTYRKNIPDSVLLTNYIERREQ